MTRIIAVLSMLHESAATNSAPLPNSSTCSWLGHGQHQPLSLSDMDRRQSLTRP